MLKNISFLNLLKNVIYFNKKLDQVPKHVLVLAKTQVVSKKNFILKSKHVTIVDFLVILPEISKIVHMFLTMHQFHNKHLEVDLLKEIPQSHVLAINPQIHHMTRQQINRQTSLPKDLNSRSSPLCLIQMGRCHPWNRHIEKHVQLAAKNKVWTKVKNAKTKIKIPNSVKL